MTEFIEGSMVITISTKKGGKEKNVVIKDSYVCVCMCMHRLLDASLKILLQEYRHLCLSALN